MMPPRGAEDETDAEGRERGQRSGVGAVVGEEELPEDECGDDSVEEEVVPFDDCADERSDCRTAGALCPSRFDCRLVFDSGHRILP